MSQELKTEIAFFEKQLSELMSDHAGKFALVKNEEIIGIFDNFQNAIDEGAKQFGLDSFLVRQIKKPTKESAPALTLGLLRAAS